MRFGTFMRRLVPAAGLALALMHALPGLGDEPSRLGRLFRFGSGSNSTASSLGSGGRSAGGSGLAVGSASGASASASGGLSGSSAGRGAPLPLGDRDPHQPVGDAYAPPALSTASPHLGTSSASGSSLTPTPRIAPKPRVNKGITEADPLVSRVALGRADGGSQFAMVTQIYADGTVIDSTGVHKISAEMLKPVVEAVSSGDFGRIKGHCGGPAGDTFENFQVVAFERAYGRLRANAFSYSGNPQGCDHSVMHLHKVLDDLQMKMATPGGGPTVASAQPAADAPATSPSPAPGLTLDAPLVAPPAAAGPSGGLGMPNLPDPGLHD